MPELIELQVNDLHRNHLEQFLRSLSESPVPGESPLEIAVAPQHMTLRVPDHLLSVVETMTALCTQNDDGTYDLNVLAFAVALDQESIASLVLHLKGMSSRYFEGYEYMCGLEPANDLETQFFASGPVAT